jgi:hypothetical protein
LLNLDSIVSKLSGLSWVFFACVSIFSGLGYASSGAASTCEGVFRGFLQKEELVQILNDRARAAGFTEEQLNFRMMSLEQIPDQTLAGKTPQEIFLMIEQLQNSFRGKILDQFNQIDNPDAQFDRQKSAATVDQIQNDLFFQRAAYLKSLGNRLVLVETIVSLPSVKTDANGKMVRELSYLYVPSAIIIPPEVSDIARYIQKGRLQFFSRNYSFDHKFYNEKMNINYVGFGTIILEKPLPNNETKPLIKSFLEDSQAEIEKKVEAILKAQDNLRPKRTLH